MNQEKETQFLKYLNDNAGIMHKICRIYFRDEEERQDVLQEIIYQLWKSYDSFHGQSKFSTWMYRVCLNTAITHVRKKGKLINQERFDEQRMAQIASEETLESEHHVNRLYDAIGSFSEIDKAIVLLYLEEKNYDEIASITGLTKSNVGVRLVRIKRRLEIILKQV